MGLLECSVTHKIAGALLKTTVVVVILLLVVAWAQCIGSGV